MVCWKKKMGRGYKIGAKDFGLKTKGRAYSGWGKTVLFCMYCTHKPVPFN